MTIKLIVTCDDCGLSQGIDQSAAALFQKGMVSTASIMTNFPHVQHSFDLLGRYPNFELGVHLNLTEGEPLTRNALKSDLVRASGRFRNRLTFFAQAVFPSVDLQQAIEIELQEQIERFIKHSGHHPAHLTTHMHFHIFPALREIVYRLAEEYNIRWVRNSDFRESVVPLIPVLNSTPKTVESPHSFFVPDYLVVVLAYLDYPHEQLLNDVLKLQGIVEIVVHPSEPEDIHFPRNVAYRPAERNRETRYLEAFFELLEPHLGSDVEVVNSVGEYGLRKK
jgi:predicted glycoside hydrolase/deacetylase ChbG (UPF0249 family)